jgi:nitrite reductase/ring-hydroxylating ferredoxin subunit
MFKSGAEPPTEDWVCVGTLEELKAKGMTILRGGSCPLLVVHDQGSLYALDNRCPHLGFPLHRGSVEDGILTCHWHHARFDLASGGTFDLWADDVPTAAVELRDDGAVWVSRRTRYADGGDHWRNRLREGCGTISASFLPKPCSVSAVTAPTIVGWFAMPCCSVSATVTGGASARPLLLHSATSSRPCRRRRPILPSSTV